MPRGRGARMLGPAAGSSGSGTACGRPPGTGKPRAAPSPARRPAGTGKGWGQPPGRPRRDLTPGPSLFLPLEPTWGTDCRRCSIYRSRGDQERILAPRENLDAWVPRGYCQRRRRGRPVKFSSIAIHQEDWWDSGLGTRALLEGWGSGGRVTIEQSLNTS